ncbi:hypothetical protein A3Q56_00117 [Intoshia linei]|uniref:Uncharacterized protein n=1 Tax=Intoshia linei TaxID=1819745 RepID=A0A177BEX2_9BILA|nr:hypothetical protein A3Q56_00117 [Intoshia linei]
MLIIFSTTYENNTATHVMSTPGFKKLLDLLQKKDFFINTNLFLIRYDIRILKSLEMEFKKKILESTQHKNGRIMLMCHSRGCSLLLFVLSSMPHFYVYNNICGIITISYSMTGTPHDLLAFLTGETRDTDNENAQPNIKHAYHHIETMPYVLPNKKYTKKIVTIDEKEYTMSELQNYTAAEFEPHHRFHMDKANRRIDEVENLLKKRLVPLYVVSGGDDGKENTENSYVLNKDLGLISKGLTFGDGYSPKDALDYVNQFATRVKFIVEANHNNIIQNNKFVDWVKEIMNIRD